MRSSECVVPPLCIAIRIYNLTHNHLLVWMPLLTLLVPVVVGLKRFPQPSLCLATPGPELTVGLHLWLGVSLFPPSPLCTCLSSIDCFGDHLLGCSQGPMRIRRHNALVSILHHALLQDHPGALKEQLASFDDNSRPVDVFHPEWSSNLF